MLNTEQVFYYQCNQEDAVGIILSCGIHGNETVPIFAIKQLQSYLDTRTRKLPFSLLLIYGNPQAIELRQRFVTTNLNRLFGSHPKPDCNEGIRADLLEQACIEFGRRCDRVLCHLDLHSTIKPSLHNQFALQPVGTSATDFTLHEKIESFFAELGITALVNQSQRSNTFSQFTRDTLKCDSFTVECGSHENPDSARAQHLSKCLKSFILDEKNNSKMSGLTAMERYSATRYRVTQSIVRDNAHFRFLIDEREPNFSAHPAGTGIYFDGERIHHCEGPVTTLFLNSSVAFGQRAGLLLTKM